MTESSQGLSAIAKLPIGETLVVSLQFCKDRYKYLAIVILLSLLGPWVLSGLTSKIMIALHLPRQFVFLVIWGVYAVAAAAATASILLLIIHQITTDRSSLSVLAAMSTRLIGTSILISASVLAIVMAFSGVASVGGGPIFYFAGMIGGAIVSVKCYLVLPAVAATGRVSLKDGWRLSREQFVRLIVLYFLAVILGIVITLVVVLPITVLVHLTGGFGAGFRAATSNYGLWITFAASHAIVAGHAFRWVDYHAEKPILEY